MRIEKGVQQKYFEDVLEGRKGFEVRLGDFEGKPGDTLVLKEQKPGSKEFTGRTIECELLYKFNTKEIEKFYKKEEIEKYGLAILAIRKKFNYK